MTTATEPTSFLPASLSDWVDLVAKVGAIFVVLFGIFEYLESQRAARVARTQDFMTRYVSDPIGAARNIISGVLRDNLQAIQDIRSAPMTASAAQQAHKDLVQFLVNESRNGAGIAAQLDTMFDFYGALETCVEQSLCEASVAHAYFGADARRLVENFKPYIAERRGSAPDYAAAAEAFMTKSSKSKP